MTHISKDKRSYAMFTGVDKHDEFLSRISKTLYYTKLPVNDCLSLPVTELAAEIFTEVKNGQTLERLDVEEASRISRNACVSPCSLVLALLYLERLKDCNPEYLQRVAPSELFLVTLMVASKFLNDDGEEDEVSNTEWAQSGKLSISKMNRLEKDFLKAIDWTVYIHNKDFWERLQRLERDIAYKEARKRGWFSYTELNSLLDSVHLAALIHALLGISSMCIMSYAAGLFTLMSSALVASHLPTVFLGSKQIAINDLSNVPCTPRVQISLHNELEEQIENIFLDSISEGAAICNQSYSKDYIFEKDINNTQIESGWKWIVDSVTFWLPNQSHYKNCVGMDDWRNQFNQNSVYITKTDFIIESDPFSQNYDNGVVNIAKKIPLESNLKISSQDWTHNIGYFSKIPLSHGQ